MSTIGNEQTNGGEQNEPSAKKQKLTHTQEEQDENSLMVVDEQSKSTLTTSNDTDSHIVSNKSFLPASRALLGESTLKLDERSTVGHTLEFDVGISEYISKNLPPIHAIIKQRFTDFLVYEVNQDGETIRIKSLDIPLTEKNEEATDGAMTISKPILSSSEMAEEKAEEKLEDKAAEESDTIWSEDFDVALQPFMSEMQIAQLKQLYLEGPEPPFVSDSGWSGRNPCDPRPPEEEVQPTKQSSGSKGERGKRGRERGRGRGGGRRNGAPRREDNRRVISDPIESKASRTSLHKLIRELFKGKFETETDTKGDAEQDGRIVIKWANVGQNRGAGKGGKERKPRGSFPPYIHFSMQKTNRDTQDALGHLSRLLRCSIKDLGVAGTKDKRGVTVQRVSLRRGSKTVEDVWKVVNGVNAYKTADEAVRQRGERGVRIADLRYRKAALELGMLKGNAFIITLRNVQVERLEVLDDGMRSLKEKGFINYYGMQRFGSASIPTHTIGLAFLRQNWQEAIDLLLQYRPGEHPDVVAARKAWLEEKDLDKALQLFPRRVVAERCILESFKKMKGDTRNAFGALSTIPRNLRLMYVHAYQSYIWNAVVSERIRLHGAGKPIPGDVVFDKGAAKESNEDEVDEAGADDEDQSGQSRGKKPWVAPRVKILTAEDVNDYTIFDVVMPLPGKDVAYPGGPLGERYKEFLKMDGLDPDNVGLNKHKDYNLSGSYRKIVLQPKELSWKVLRYTDPDVPLAQADEDKLLGFEPPVIDETGKFIALQIELQLSTAAYATMALREVTKTETSSHYQTNLTATSEDQMFRGTIAQDPGETDA